MGKYVFHIEWTTDIYLEASSEEEAWDMVNGEMVDAFGKGKGDTRIDLEDYEASHHEWDDFDTDPEDDDITSIAVDNDYYL